MAYTESELKWLEEHGEEINNLTSISSFEEFIKRFFDYGTRIGLLLAYTIFGSSAFALKLSKKTPDLNIQGAIYNLTNLRVEKGVPLTTSMFKANSKVVMYRIENHRIKEQFDYSLVSREAFNKEVQAKNINLVIQDSKAFRDRVTEIFGAKIIYTGWLVFLDKDKDKLILEFPQVRGSCSSVDELSAIKEVKEMAHSGLLSLLKEEFIEVADSIFKDLAVI